MSQVSNVSACEPRWLTLPATPQLPAGGRKGVVEVADARIWYAVYGSGAPVILLHGGLGNSDYWGLQVGELAKTWQVIVMDSRGHGRSSRGSGSMSYDLMAGDVMALMAHLALPKAAIIGWSDGAIIGLLLAIRHPDLIAGVFSFGANSDPSGTHDFTKSVVFNAYIARTGEEYALLSSTPGGFKRFFDEMMVMWTSQPNIAAGDLQKIRVPVWVVDGDHEEAIKRDDTLFIADNIPGSGLLIQPEVSHFSILQNPHQFTEDILRFLREKCIA